MTHTVIYSQDQKGSWWFLCQTCGDEGGPCEGYEQLINLDIQHEQDYAKGVRDDALILLERIEGNAKKSS